MSYEWDHNCAVVDRCFYYLYIVRGTSLVLGGLALRDLWLIKQNWFPERLRGRLPVYLGLWAVTNAVSAWFLLWPLTPEERRQQWVKYQVLGKFNYSLSFLDIDEDRKEWARYKAERGSADHGSSSSHH